MSRVLIHSWNIARRASCWRAIQETKDVDIFLLQEVLKPPRELEVDVMPATSGWGDGFRTAVVNRSGILPCEWIPTAPVGRAGRGLLPESRPGSLTAVRVGTGAEAVTLVSVYSAWENPTPEKSAWSISSDASAHRLISDLSALIGSVRGHRIIVCGDWNILHGYGEDGSAYWSARYETVFARMQALGLPFIGPQAPHGVQADPWPDELPRSSANVPTFKTARGRATRQLDFAFASRDLADRTKVRALNRESEWGPSDHCRIEIELELS